MDLIEEELTFEEFCRSDMNILEFKNHCEGRIIRREFWYWANTKRKDIWIKEYHIACKMDRHYPVWKLKYILK
jgi:hypothetical protein